MIQGIEFLHMMIYAKDGFIEQITLTFVFRPALIIWLFFFYLFIVVIKYDFILSSHPRFALRISLSFPPNFSCIKFVLLHWSLLFVSCSLPLSACAFVLLNSFFFFSLTIHLFRFFRIYIFVLFFLVSSKKKSFSILSSLPLLNVRESLPIPRKLNVYRIGRRKSRSGYR